LAEGEEAHSHLLDSSFISWRILMATKKWWTSNPAHIYVCGWV